MDPVSDGGRTAGRFHRNKNEALAGTLRGLSGKRH